MGTPNSYIYSTATYNATSSSWSPISKTGTPQNQVSIQNKFYGVILKADELILLQNGEIFSSSTEGVSWSLQYQTPVNPILEAKKTVMAWTCSFCTGIFNGMSRMNASITQIEQNREDFNAISYEFYELNSSGGVNPLSVGTLSYSIMSASLQNIETFLANQTYINIMIKQMVADSLLYNYTGYNIDWEPTTANNTTGIMFANFLNEFSLQLNKYGKHLTVDVATWNPGFWNFSVIGDTNITYVDVMDYSPVYSGPSSFMQELQYSVKTIPNAKLQIALINTNVNTNANITPIQMSEFFSALEYLNISSVSMWVLPVNSSILSMMQQFMQMGNYGKFSISGIPGSSGFNITVTNNSIQVYEQNNSYVNGTLLFKTGLLNSSSIDDIKVISDGQIPFQLYAENISGWHLIKNYSSSTNITIQLLNGTYNVGFLFNSSQGYITANFTEEINFNLVGTLIYPGWLNIYQPVNYKDYLNGVLFSSYVTQFVQHNYGPYVLINMTVPAGTYNISEVSSTGSSNYQNITINQLSASGIYVQESPPRNGYIKGYVSPSNASITVNGIVVKAENGYFSLNLTQGSYWINATSDFYSSFSTEVNVTMGAVTWINISLILLPPKPVQLYVPMIVNNTTFSISWSEFIGLGFINYTLYVSNTSSSIGEPIASITNMSQTTYNISNLAHNTTYFVTVKVFSSSGSATSNVQSFKTPPLKVVKTTTTVTKTPTSTNIYEYAAITIVVVIIVAIIFMALILKGRKKENNQKK